MQQYLCISPSCSSFLPWCFSGLAGSRSLSFSVSYFFRDCSPALEKGDKFKSPGTGFMCSCIWWKSGTFVLLLLFTWNPSREYLFIALTLYWKQRSFAASSTGTWLAVTTVRFWEMVVFQQFPVSSMLLDISWVTVFLSLLKMSKSLVQNCGAEYLVSFSFRSPETGTWSSNLPTSKASEYW